jgi:hypothetical protein
MNALSRRVQGAVAPKLRGEGVFATVWMLAECERLSERLVAEEEPAKARLVRAPVAVENVQEEQQEHACVV